MAATYNPNPNPQSNPLVCRLDQWRPNFWGASHPSMMTCPDTGHHYDTWTPGPRASHCAVTSTP